MRMLNIIDEFTHECLAIRVSRRLKSIDVIDVLSDLFILRGVPAHIRSDNGPEFVAKAVQEWIAAVGAKTAYITPGGPGRTASSKALMRVCAMSCSTVRSSTRCARPRSSSRAGAGTTMLSGRMPRSTTGLQLRRCSCRPSPHGRLRNPDQLRRPCSSWC
jgi:transposase InsO family protein